MATLAIMPQYKAGQLKILATTSPERLNNLPEVPTLKEVGFDFVRFGWLGVCAGTGTPAAIVARLNRDIGTIVSAPDYRDLIEKTGSIPLSSSPKELERILSETYQQTLRVSREYGIYVD